MNPSVVQLNGLASRWEASIEQDAACRPKLLPSTAAALACCNEDARQARLVSLQFDHRVRALPNCDVGRPQRLGLARQIWPLSATQQMFKRVKTHLEDTSGQAHHFIDEVAALYETGLYADKVSDKLADLYDLQTLRGLLHVQKKSLGDLLFVEANALIFARSIEPRKGLRVCNIAPLEKNSLNLCPAIIGCCLAPLGCTPSMVARHMYPAVIAQLYLQLPRPLAQQLVNFVQSRTGLGYLSQLTPFRLFTRQLMGEICKAVCLSNSPAN